MDGLTPVDGPLGLTVAPPEVETSSPPPAASERPPVQEAPLPSYQGSTVDETA